MISSHEVDRLKREAAELGRYSIHIAVVLSLVFSLTAVAILSKQQLTNNLWLDLVVITVPILIALYFKKRIALLGAFVYAVAMILALVAAVLFGI